MAEKIAPVILSALELNVHFGEQVILDKASLSVHEGDRIGLVGRNGAGKSTFLKIIFGSVFNDLFSYLVIAAICGVPDF